MKNKIAVIGAGSFGTSLAMTLIGKGHEVSIWGRKKSQMELMRTTLENPHYLPGIKLPVELNIVDQMGDALEGAEIVLFSVPAQQFRTVFTDAKSGLMIFSAIFSPPYSAYFYDFTTV